MESLLIYSALRNELPSVITEQVNYVISNNFIDFNVDYSIGIYVNLTTPKHVYRDNTIRPTRRAGVTILFQAGLSTDSVYDIRSIIEDVETYLATLNNKEVITQSNFELLPSGKIHRVKTEADRQVADARGIKIEILKTVVRSIVSDGKNENGRELFTMNVDFAYNIIGNNIVTETTTTEDDDTTGDEEPADNSASTDNSDSTDNAQED